MKYASLLIIVVLHLTACSSAPTTVQRYTLHSAANSNSATALELPGGLGVGPIELPESWRRGEIVVWGEANEVITSDRHLWAGDPKLALSRVLATNLSEQLQMNNVWAHPWDSHTRPQHQIVLVVEKFGGKLGGDVELTVKWRFAAERGAQTFPTQRRTFTTKAADDSYDAYVAALNQLVTDLSAALEQSIREYTN